MGRRVLILLILLILLSPFEHCGQRWTSSREIGKELVNIAVLGLSVGDVHAGPLDDQVLAAQGLCNLVISECDEGERSERFGNEHVRDLAVLHEELSEVVNTQVLCAAAHKDFSAAHGLIRTSLRVW